MLAIIVPLLFVAGALAQTGCSCDGYNIGITYENGTTVRDVSWISS